MNLNLNIEFLLQIFVYIVTLGMFFGKISGRMDNHDYKIDRLEQNQNEKLNQLEKNYDEKIKRLEAKQDKHNHLIERMYGIEQSVAIFTAEKNNVIEKINDIEHDLEKLQHFDHHDTNSKGEHDEK